MTRLMPFQVSLAAQKQLGLFNDYIRLFVDHPQTIDNQITNYKEAPTKTELRNHVQGAESKASNLLVLFVSIHS